MSHDFYNPLLVLDIPTSPLSTIVAALVVGLTVQIAESATSWGLSFSLLPQLSLRVEHLAGK
jgi:hypothetical protein